MIVLRLMELMQQVLEWNNFRAEDKIFCEG